MRHHAYSKLPIVELTETELSTVSASLKRMDLPKLTGEEAARLLLALVIGRRSSGPISPASNGATKMPSGRWASSRAKFVFRSDSGRPRRSI